MLTEISVRVFGLLIGGMNSAPVSVQSIL